MKRILLALSALALAAGCSSSSSSSTTTSGSTGKTTAGTATTSTSTSGSTGHGSTGSTGTAGSTGGSSGTTGTSAGACTEITAGAFAADAFGNFVANFTPDIGVPGPDILFAQVFVNDAGAFSFAAAPNDNYQTCNDCLLARDLFPDAGIARSFYPSSGTFNVVTSDGANTALTGSLSDVILREVTIDVDAGYLSTVVDGGSCLHITTASINVLPPPPPDAGPNVPGDLCTTALPLATQDGGYFFVSSDTSTAHDDTFSAVCGGSGKDIFYTFTVGATSDIVATLTPANTSPDAGYRPVVDLRPSCDLADGGTPELACGRAADLGIATSSYLARVPAGTYYAVVDGANGSEGAFSLAVSVQPPSTPPANDACGAGAVALTLGTPATGTTRGATDDFSALRACFGTPTGSEAPDVVYAFTPATSGRFAVTVTPADATFDPAVYLLGSTCTAGAASSCTAGGAATGFGQPASLTAQLTAGTTYYLVVDGNVGSSGAFTIGVAVAPAGPVNDTCTGAIPLVVGTPVTGDTTTAYNDYTSAGPSSCFGYTNPHMQANDLVYAFNPLTTGFYNFTMTPTVPDGGTGADVAFYLVATCPTGPVDACVGGADQGGPGTPESLTVNLTAGTNYLLIADGYSATDNGPFTLAVVNGYPDGGP